MVDGFSYKLSGKQESSDLFWVKRIENKFVNDRNLGVDEVLFQRATIKLSNKSLRFIETFKVFNSVVDPILLHTYSVPWITVMG